MKKIYQFLSLSFFTLWSLSLMAQEVRVSGKVTATDAAGGLPGVSVRVKGSTRGAVTDGQGNYQLSVPANASLIVSYVGYEDIEEAVNGRSIINFEMQTSTRDLSEVVVTGYGSQIKRELTGNIAKIKASEIATQPVTTFEQAMQGKAAGVQINQGSGKLGQGMQIRVRGQSSVSASNEPLYIIDGIPVVTNNLSQGGGGATNPLSDINPQDIESIEILKDASAAAIYGARAANGVVIISTKSGKSGKTNVNFSAQYGNSQPTRIVQFLDTNQYIDFYTKAAGNSDRIEGIDPNSPDSYTGYMKSFFQTQSLGTTGTNTNWAREAFQSAPMGQFDLNVSGGSDKTSVYLSGQYLNQTGIVLGNAFDRYSGRLNVSHKVSNRVTVGLNTSIARSLNQRISGDRQFDNPVQMVALPPMTPLRDPTTGLPVGTPPGDISIPVYYNPLINIGNAYYNATVHRNISNLFGELKIVEGLKFRSEFALDLLNQQEEQYYNSKTQRNFGAPNGIGNNWFTRVENYNTNNYLTYNREFGVHGLNLVGGMSYQNFQQKNNYVQGRDFPSDAYRQLASAAKTTSGSSAQTDFRFLSYFLRGNYRLNDRYLFSASARMDGSSRFGANNRFGFFPAVSAGWVVSEEGFMKDNRTFSFLKLRASYGLTGNAEVGNFPQLGLFIGDATYGTLPGQRPSQLANPDLSWETTAQADIGIDFGFLKNRINGEIDFYNKQTNGLLLNVNVPATSGFATMVKNVGSLTNRGVEFVLNTENLVGEFKWKTSLNLAHNRNTITDIQGQVIQGGLSNMSRAIEGQPLGVFYTVEYAGVDPANGDALWYKNTKNADGTLDRTTTNRYNEAQNVIIGSPQPKLIGGITNTFSYKGVDLSVFFNGVYGNLLNFYGVGRFSSANGRYEDNQTVNQLAAWTAQNPNTRVPEARLFYNNGAQPSSRFIEDGSYLRLRNVTLGYTLPKTLLNRARINSARLFVSGQNLLTFTKYSGWDPEVNADDIVTNIAQGYDFYTTPQARTITAGFNIGF